MQAIKDWSLKKTTPLLKVNLAVLWVLRRKKPTQIRVTDKIQYDKAVGTVELLPVANIISTSKCKLLGQTKPKLNSLIFNVYS